MVDDWIIHTVAAMPATVSPSASNGPAVPCSGRYIAPVTTAPISVTASVSVSAEDGWSRPSALPVLATNTIPATSPTAKPPTNQR
jgi:hypothetical protein